MVAAAARRSGGYQNSSSSSSLIPSRRSTAARSIAVAVSPASPANEVKMAGRESISVMSRSKPTGPISSPRPVLSGAILRTLLQLFNHGYFELLGARVFIINFGRTGRGLQAGPRLVLRMADVTWQELLAYCLAKPSAWQDEPWEGDVVVKVGAKIFAFLGSGTSVGVKCGASREAADEWLLRYPDDASVMAYIGRSGWNSLRTDGAIPDDELIDALDASYAAVVSKLPKKDRPV